MKRTRTEKRSLRPEGKGTPQDVDEYLAGVPEPARSMLSKIRGAIRSAAPPEATEAISYRMPALKFKGVLMWYGAFSNHCSLFPTASIVKEFKNELKGFSISKGTIHLPMDEPLPIALIKKMVKARVRQIESKTRR